MEINRENLANFRSDFEKLNHAMELKYGVVINLGNISFNSKSFTGKITVSNNEDGVDDSQQVEFNALCGRYGFKESDYMRNITTPGSTSIFKLIGFKPGNRKYPIIAELNGKKYKLSKDISFC